MSINKKAVTTADLETLERATTQAFSIVVGLLAEAVGSHKLAYHFGATLNAVEQTRPNPQRDRLLEEAYRLVLLKALRAAPGDPVLQEMQASLKARKTTH